MSKMPNDPAERSRVCKAAGKDGWCVWCSEPVTKAEYQRDHFGGKCAGSAGAGETEVTKSISEHFRAITGLETDAEKYERLAKSVSDREIAAHYRRRAEQARQQLSEGKR